MSGRCKKGKGGRELEIGDERNGVTVKDLTMCRIIRSCADLYRHIEKAVQIRAQ